MTQPTPVRHALGLAVLSALITLTACSVPKERVASGPEILPPAPSSARSAIFLHPDGMGAKDCKDIQPWRTRFNRVKSSPDRLILVCFSLDNPRKNQRRQPLTRQGFWLTCQSDIDQLPGKTNAIKCALPKVRRQIN